MTMTVLRAPPTTDGGCNNELNREKKKMGKLKCVSMWFSPLSELTGRRDRCRVVARCCFIIPLKWISSSRHKFSSFFYVFLFIFPSSVIQKQTFFHHSTGLTSVLLLLQIFPASRIETRLSKEVFRLAGMLLLLLHHAYNCILQSTFLSLF